MPSSAYCRRQAALLLEMATAASDPALVERLRIRAEQYLAEAEVADDPSAALTRAIEAFNDEQMRD